ncbi:hypothetical protein [Octadecabacter ascidiaceicola]|uniref:Uncharacterized protein n=1 Tax=Octadecabacter ascidiaceicola TaxID=1655543 RepID=A0A238JP53_9RHOB|nr:hypothetical protein [Octadecabacter ascidiaceicola]SMX31652.1 hypothetical protein OCA8868_00469 [Octadecabacter ascidiaceicola]
MKKLLVIGIALVAIVGGSYLKAQGREISSEVPWDNQAAEAVL